MSDFFQNGVITTFHKLTGDNYMRLEKELHQFAKTRPIALILPSLYREFESGALPKIVEHLSRVNYLNEIILCLDRSSESQFKKVKQNLKSNKKMTIIWNDSPEMIKLYGLLNNSNLSPGESGKGRAVWISLGYILAQGKSRVIAVHDCDIENYNRELLARLCYPLANPNYEYDFCKGYYSRITDRMYGRATRLFFTPLIRALVRILGHLPFLVYIDSFRYALAGEIVMHRDLAKAMRIPSDWGLEVGTLAEVYRSVTNNRICQVDIADNYEHKHQPLVPNDPETGILKMTVDITKSIFRTLALEGVQFSEGFFKTLSSIYLRVARDTIIHYENDAQINGLKFDRHNESTAVEAFADGIKLAGELFWENPSHSSLIPNWNRIIAALPDFLFQLKAAVLKYN